MPFLSVDCDNWITVEDVYDQKQVVKDTGGVWDSINRVPFPSRPTVRSNSAAPFIPPSSPLS